MAFRKHQMRAPSEGPKQHPGKNNPGSAQHAVAPEKGACSVCEMLDVEHLSSLEAAWTGGAPLSKLAQSLKKQGFEVTQKALERHERVCLVNRHKSRYSRVAQAFDNLYEALDVAHRAYLAAPNRSNALSYQALVGELRVIMTDLDRVQNADELADDLVAFTLNPLIQSLSQTLISEVGAVKEELMTKFDEAEADEIASDLLRRTAAHFKAATERSRDRILEVLSARDKNRGQTLRGGQKKPQGKHGNLRAVS